MAATDVSFTPIGDPEPFLLIGIHQTNGHFFDGLMDDIRIWSAELEEQTIETWMGRTLDATHPDFASLEAAWSFDEAAGQAAASLVNSPARDAQLGDTDMQDPSDPTWVEPGVAPTRAVSVGQVKGRYLPPAP